MNELYLSTQTKVKCITIIITKKDQQTDEVYKPHRARCSAEGHSLANYFTRADITITTKFSCGLCKSTLSMWPYTLLLLRCALIRIGIFNRQDCHKTPSFRCSRTHAARQIASEFTFSFLWRLRKKTEDHTTKQTIYLR